MLYKLSKIFLRNKFYGFMLIYFFYELYSYIKYIKLYNYYNKLKAYHKRIPNRCLKWMIHNCKRQPNKRLLLNNLFKKELLDNEQISVKNFKEYVYYNVLSNSSNNVDNKSLKDATNNETTIINKFYQVFKDYLVDNDVNHELTIINKDKLETIYKPTIIYGLIKVFRLLGNIKLKLKGYKIDRNDGINIYYRIKDDSKPILFFHGLGVGIMPYIDFLPEDKNIIAPEMPNISNSNFK